MKLAQPIYINRLYIKNIVINHYSIAEFLTCYYIYLYTEYEESCSSFYIIK